MKFAGLAFALLAACAPIRYASQDVVLRHEAESDTLDVLILYEGIQAQPQKQLFQPATDGIEEGLGFVRSVLAQRRQLVLNGLHFDLDMPLERPESEGTQATLVQETENCLRHVRVERSGFFRGEEGRLGLYQHVRVREAHRLVALANLAFAYAIEEKVQEGRFEDSTPWLDAETRASWIALARDRRPVFTLGTRGLEVELPMTAGNAAELLSAMTRESAESREAAQRFATLLSSLTEISIADDKVRLRWDQREARFTFPEGDDSAEYDGALAGRIQAWAGFPEALPSRAETIAEFERR
jgi:hypothetical protein